MRSLRASLSWSRSPSRALRRRAPAEWDMGGPMLEMGEARMAELEEAAVQRNERPGTPSVFSCPECGGVLWELADGELTRYRCRVGHAYSPDTLSSKQLDTLEDALWAALRALEEQAALALRLADRAAERGQRQIAARFHSRRREVQDQAEVIREVLANGRALSATPAQAEL